MNTFREATRNKDFVLTATLPLSESMTTEELGKAFTTLRDTVDAVHVGDDRSAQSVPDALAVAAIALRHGVDPVVHLTCRDRNKLALQSRLLGLAAVGVTSVVLSRGQKIPDALRGKVKGVFDTTTLQLMEMARHIGAAADPDGEPAMYIGSRAAVTRPAANWRAGELEKRVEAGARFVLTLPCLNTDMLRAWAAALVHRKLTHRIGVFVDVPILTSVPMAQGIRELFPGSRLPAAVLRRIATEADSERAGRAIAAEALRTMAAIPGISGANLIFDDDIGSVAEVIALAGL